MEKKEYRVVGKDIYDKYGEVSSTCIHLQYKVKFLWFTYWRYVRSKRNATPDGFTRIIRFEDEKSAIIFAEDHICKCKPYDTMVKTILHHKVCD